MNWKSGDSCEDRKDTNLVYWWCRGTWCSSLMITQLPLLPYVLLHADNKSSAGAKHTYEQHWSRGQVSLIGRWQVNSGPSNSLKIFAVWIDIRWIGGPNRWLTIHLGKLVRIKSWLHLSHHDQLKKKNLNEFAQKVFMPLRWSFLLLPLKSHVVVGHGTSKVRTWVSRRRVIYDYVDNGGDQAAFMANVIAASASNGFRV